MVMNDLHESNSELEHADVFTLVNNYFLLFFGVSCVLASMYVQELFLAMNQYRLGISVSALVGIILPVYLLTRRIGPGFRAQVRLVRPHGSKIVLVALATLAVVVLIDHIYLINQRFSPVPQEYTDSLMKLKPTGALSFALTFVGLCVMVPLGEEIVFRGIIQQTFARNMGGVLAFILAGIAFGVVHLTGHLLISVSVFGVYLGYVFWATRNLTYTVFAHGIFNAVALTQLAASGAGKGDSPPFYLTDVRVTVVAIVLFVFFLVKIKRGGPDTGPPRETLPPGDASI